MTVVGFPEKFLFAWKWAKCAGNGPQVEFFLVFIKFCHYFLLEVACNEKHCNLQLSWENVMSGKLVVHKLWARMLLSNQIVGFLDHEYLWTLWINLFGFLHGDIHQGKVASENTIFGEVCPGMPIFV